MKDVESLLIESKPIQCDKCKGKIYHVGSGKYYCNICGYEILDDYGKVKMFLEENGADSVLSISKETGVYPKIIEKLLKLQGWEIPKESQYYRKCEKCGCSVHYERFCPHCVYEMAGGIKTLLKEDIREKARLELSEKAGKMHYIRKR